MALDIKNWGFQLKRAGGGSQDKKTQEKLENVTVDQAIDRLGNRSTCSSGLGI